MLTIVIGKDSEGRHFKVHKDILCAQSAFFRFACSEEAQEIGPYLHEDNSIHPPTITPEEFQIYVDWVYTSQVSFDADNVIAEQLLLTDMFIIGKLLRDHELRVETMKRLIANIARTTEIPDPDYFSKVYASTEAGSDLRRFAVQWVLCCADREKLEKNIAEYPVEFVREFAVEAATQIPTLTSDKAAILIRELFMSETAFLWLG